MKSFYLLPTFLICFFISYFANAEGTKQLMPDSADNKNAYILPANGSSAGNLRDPFALYNGDTNYRLKIYINDFTKERIFFGLGAVVFGGGAVNWRIHNPDGSVLWTGTTPASGIGFIKYASQAYAGPNVINPLGYPALEVIPTVNGEFFMTFELPSNSSRKYKYFDITVVDTTTYTAKEGRVFSKCWQLSTMEPDYHGFYGNMFPYSTDGIVTKFDPNGFNGRMFSISCNKSGCYPVGPSYPPEEARKSVEGWHNYPQYRIFLNDPDSLVFPSGVLGSLVQNNPVVQITNHCDNGTIDFTFEVTAPGTIIIVLQLSSLGPPYQDRIIQIDVQTGWNTVSWDGYDGTLPVPIIVPDGSSFNYTLTYLKGITHLPLWDVENNENGFKVILVRPAGPEPNFYWDDSNLNPPMSPGPPKSPEGGCVSSINPCHIWSDIIDPGDNRTVNTWWYVTNTSTAPDSIKKEQKPGDLGTINGPDQICQGSSAQYFVTADPHSQKYIWTWLTHIDTTIVSSVMINIPANAPPGPFQVSVRGWNEHCGDGSTSAKTVTINQIPAIANTPLSKNICSGTYTNISLTSNPVGATFSWISPVTTCTANILTCPAGSSGSTINDLLTLTNQLSGTVIYHITPHANGCDGPMTDYTVTVYPTPDLSNSPLSKAQCNNLNTNIPLNSNVSGTLFTWTAAGSSSQVTGFTSNSTPSATINDVLINSGYNIETVTYHITPHANNCNGIIYDYVVTVYPTPDLLNSPLSKSQCNNQNTNITLTTNVSGTLFTWTAAGSSSQVTGFTSNSIPSATINDVLINSGYNIETVTYHITPHANGCDGPMTDYTVTVYPTPDLSNSPLSKAQCNNLNTNIPLNSNVSGTLFTWTAAGSSSQVTGFTSNSTPSATINDVLINSGYNIETVTYHITPHANGCDGPMTNYTVTVYPTPDLSNSPLSKAQCNNLNTNIPLNSNVSGTLFTWTATGSSPQVTGYTINSIPSATINDVLINSGYNIETVTYHITPHSNNCNGIIYDYVVTVYPTPDLSNSPLSKSQCNNQNTNITLTTNVSGTLFTWTAAGSSPQVTGFTSNSTPSVTINDVLINSGYNIETVTYHITPHANGCDGPMTNYTVTVYPTPDLSNSPLSKAQCNNLNTNIPLNSNVSGTLFTWTAAGSSSQVTGFTSNSIPSATINDVLINSGYNIETVTYHITPHANNCDGIIYDYVVTVYPTPDLSNSPLSKAQCNNLNTNIPLNSNVSGTLFTWTATGSSPQVTGYTINNIPSSTISDVLINTGSSIETVTYHITPHANNCDGIIYDYVVTVYPTPDLSNSPLSKSQCNNQNTNITLTTNVSGTLFTWTASGSSPQVTGFTSNSTPSATINDVLINSGYNIETVTYHITPHANNCNGIIYDYVVTVYPTPDLSNSPLSKAQCNNLNTNIPLNSNVSGTLFTWTATGSSPQVTGYTINNIPSSTISDVLINTGSSIETVTYHITPHANNCDGIIYDYVVTVYPMPDLSNSPLSKSQCNNQNTNITLTTNVSGTLFTWTASGSSPQVTGFTSNSIPSATINDVLINSGYNIETVTYHITPHANGCDGPMTDYTVTVYPTPDLSNSPLSKAQCNNLNTNIPLNSNVSGTLFTWTAAGSSPQVTGFTSNSIPLATINDVLINSGYNIETVTYHITPHANGCDGPMTDYTVTVYPTPDLSNSPLSKAQCNNLNTNIPLNSNVSGTLFTWTATGSSPQVTGYTINNIPSSTISDILINTGSSIETVTYHITPHANNCDGIIYDYVVTVYPTPDLSNSPLSKAQCNNLNTNIPLNSNVSGTLFTWTASGSSPQVTGFTSNSTPSVTINDVLINSGYNIETVTYHITPHANGCDGPMTDYTVTVYPTPDLSNSPLSKAQCNNLNTNIPLNSNVSGTLFTWTATGSSPQVTGYTINNIPSSTISDVLINTGSLIETVTYHITPHANNCDGIIYDYVVTVYPTPDLSNSPLSKSQCNNQNTNITLTTNVSGTLFTWTAAGSSPQVTGFTSNSTPSVTINDLLINSGYNIETVTYHITPHANGCDGPMTDYTVTVYPTPDLSNSPLSKAQCNNLNTNIPLNSNVSGTLFTWTAAGSSSQVTGFTSNSTPSATINDVLINSGYNIETVTYHITPHANNCNGIIYDYVVTVYPTPDLLNSPLSKSQCNNQNTNITLTTNVSGTLFTWTAAGSSSQVTGFTSNSIPSATINDVLINSGYNIETVTYHITPHANGCDGLMTDYTVTVYPTPDLSNSPLSKAQCNNLNTNIPLNSNVSGTLFTWTAAGSSSQVTGFTSNSTPSATINDVLINSGYNIETVTYHITPHANGCDGPMTDFIVTIYPTPDLSNSPQNQQQCNNLATNLTLTSNVASTLFTWTCTPSSGNITGWSNSVAPGTVINQTLANASLFAETVTYHLTPHANGCDGPVTDFVVTVIFKPALTNSPLNKAICNNTSTNITLTANVSGTLFTWLAIGGSPGVTGYSDNNTNPTVTLDQTLINSSNIPQTVTYRIVPHAVGCEGDTTNFVVTVQPTPNLTTLPLNKQQCNNLATNIILTSNVAGALFTWTATGSSVLVTGYSDNSIPTTLVNQTLINSGYNIETVTYHITPHANNCDGIVYDYVVTVYPTPDLSNSPLSKSQCNNQNTNITLTTNVSGTLFTWTAAGSSPQVTGFTSNSIPSVTINDVLINSGYNIETVTYHITPHANGCDGPMTDYTVTVYPTPDLSNSPLSKAQCNNLNTNIPLNSNVSGTLFTWTAAGSSSQVTGFTSNSTPSATINDVLINSGYNIETVTYHITPHANNCNGIIYDYVVTVYPTPDLSNSPLSKAQCNNLNTNIPLNSNVSGTLFTWTATGSSPQVTGYTINNIPSSTISDVLINTGSSIETVTYHITPHANNCDGIVYDYGVTVYPMPDLSNSPLSKSQCNNQNTNITLTTNVSGTLFTWTASGSSPQVTGFTSNSIPSATINDVLINSGYNIETVTYHITPHANGCDGPMTDYTVTVYPTPDLSNSPLSKAQCNNLNTNIPLNSNVSGTLFTWTAAGSSSQVTGFTSNSTPSATISDVLINTGSSIETVTYHITPHANNCDGIVYDYVVTVYPMPDLSNSPLSKSQCNNQNTNITLTTNVSGTLFTWTAAGSSPQVTGFTSNSIPSVTINDVLINSGYDIETVTYHITPHANGCDGLMTDYTVTVYPTPDLSNSPLSKAQCNNLNTNIPLNSNVSGTLFTWTASGSSPQVTGFTSNSTPSVTINDVLINSGYNIETVTYHITPHANGCDGPMTDYTVTVYPTPDLSNSPLSKAQCNNLNTNIPLNSNVSGTLFTWTATGSSPQVTGYTINNIPSSTISDVLINTGSSIETVTYHITPHANGCDGPMTDYSVTVLPTPDLSNNPLNSQICNKTSVNQTLTSNVTGTLFTWTATGSSPQVTGYSDNNIPSVTINDILNNAGLNVEAVTYHITPHANGCDGPVIDFVVSVVQTPDVYFSAESQTICSGQSSLIQVLSHVPGTTFTWTTASSSGNLSGYSNGSGSIIAQVVTNSGTTIETVTYTVYPTVFGCQPGPSQNVILTVNPKPAITNTTTSLQQCSPSFINIVLSSSIPGSTFTWTATGSSANVTGFSNGGGLIISQDLTNTGYNIETVIYNVTPIVNNCNGDPVAFTVTVFPVPDVYFTPASQAICPLQTSNIINNSHVAGSSFTWNATGSSFQVTGYSGGSGNQIQQTLNNASYNIETVTYQVSPMANGCPGVNDNVVVTVNPDPVVSFSLCLDPVTTTNAQPIQLKGGIPFNGTYSGRGVSSSILYPAIAGAGMDTIYYSYTNTYGCSRNSYIVLSIVSPLFFSCGNTLIDPRDSKQYPTVQIGIQCWMAANLDYGQQLSASVNQRDNCVIEKYCYNDNPDSCTTSGGLYQWDEIMKYENSPAIQGLCPPGWHIPTETEWNTLFTFYTSNGYAGTPLKYSGNSGFNASLDGVRFKNASWSFVNFATLFWSSSPHGPYKAWAHGMNEYNTGVSFYPASRANGFSVRCIND